MILNSTGQRARNKKRAGRCLKFIFFSRIQAGKNNARELVTLVGLFPLHSGPGCEKIVSVKNYNGFQRMEAFVLALNELNYKRQQRLQNVVDVKSSHSYFTGTFRISKFSWKPFSTIPALTNWPNM